MGKILAKFMNGYAGAISRNVDDVVITLPNVSNGNIAFGDPVFLSSNKDGGVGYASATNPSADNFLGVAVRIGIKTPAGYDDNTGAYAPGDLMSVIVRGSVVAKCVGSGVGLGDPVSIFKTTGGFGTGTGDNYIPLDNVRVAGTPDSNYFAELVITERNIR